MRYPASVGRKDIYEGNVIYEGNDIYVRAGHL
jgi:hypothetical protein